MREYELEVLEQYHIEVESTRKIRGAFFCDTDQGVMILRETNVSKRRALYFYMLCKQLEEAGFEKVDTIVPTAEGTFLSTSREGRSYVLKRWFRGNECDVKSERDVLGAVRNLARLHLVLYWHAACSLEDQEEIHPPGVHSAQEVFARHTAELAQVRRYVRRQPTKREFEEVFLRHYEEMYGQAILAGQMLEESGYDRLFEESFRNQCLAHGDYNYHNLLMTPEGIATTNFEKTHLDVQVSDLAYLIRKVMEKQHWKPQLGQKMLDAYEQIRPLSEAEKEYVAIRLFYPEKYWKTVNAYYLSNKSWISEKMVQKLRQTIQEMTEKRCFLEKIFPFLL